MAKTYLEKLLEWSKARKQPTQRDKNLVAFLAVRDDVKAALDTGYSAKLIWANLHETKCIEFGYDTFLNYVNRLIRREQSKGKKPTAQIPDTKPEPDKDKPAAPGFTYNPTPNKEELL